MQTWLNDLLPSLQSLGVWGYWVIGLLAFGEALVLTSVFVPGTVVVILGGALSARGLYDFGDMIWFVAAGTILGAEVSFRIGARGGRLFREDRKVFSTAHLERGKRFFSRYGAASIVIAHFLGPMRPIVPVIAGLSDMSRKLFFLWNAVGGLTYAIAMLSAGYIFGAAFDIIGATVTRVGLFVLAVMLILAALWYFAAKIRRAWPFFVSILSTVGAAIRDNPEVRALATRHPVLLRFLDRRVSQASFTGLPVSILALTICYFLVLYADSTLDFVTQSQIVLADVRIANLLAAFRDPDLVRFFAIVTALGYWKVILVLAVGVSVPLWLKTGRHYLPALWLAVMANQLTVTLLKHFFARPRPELAVYAETSFSFPSGHSAVSVVFYGFATYILIRERTAPVIVSFLAGATLVFLIGLSRLYLVEHYLSDVLNGYLVGALWMLAGIWLAEGLRARGVKSASAPMLPWQKAFSALAICGTVLGAGLIVADYRQTRNLPAVQALVILDKPLEKAFTEGRLPPRAENILGTPQEPVSLIILAQDEDSLLAALHEAGWRLTDEPDFGTLSRAAFAAWFGGSYSTAPVTPTFWNGHPNDFGFQSSSTGGTIRQRHIARFWRTGFRSQEGLMIFVGTASFNVGLKWGLTYRIDPNIDAERDLFVANLQDTGLVHSTGDIQLLPPTLGKNFTGDPFFTDGKSTMVRLLASTGVNQSPASR